MKPETIQKLHTESPEFKELLGYLATEAEKLKDLSHVSGKSDRDFAIDGKARLAAYDLIVEILGGLLPQNPISHGSVSAEYAIELPEQPK